MRSSLWPLVIGLSIMSLTNAVANLMRHPQAELVTPIQPEPEIKPCPDHGGSWVNHEGRWRLECNARSKPASR